MRCEVLKCEARRWQFITAAFAHASWEHLSSNIFMLYVFGRIVEEEEGALGVWLTYIVCSVGTPPRLPASLQCLHGRACPAPATRHLTALLAQVGLWRRTLPCRTTV